MNRKDLLLSAIHSALNGGEAILEVYDRPGGFQIEHKEDHSPLTEADKAAHLQIMAGLKGTGIPVLSEEGKAIPYSERSTWDALWVVDPLDGTKEFIKGNGEFTVNIALVEKGVPTLGVIYVPVSDTLYFGDVESAAVKVESVKSIGTMSDLKSLENAGQFLPIESKRPFTVVGSRSHMNEDTRHYIEGLEAEHGRVEIISRGSSLKICLVAEGLADEYPRFAPTMEWDTAAGHALASAAGKSVINPNTGEALRYNKEDLLNPHFLVR